MCRSHSDGGRRCSRNNPTRAWRTQVTQRLARNRRVLRTRTAEQARHLADLVQRDEALLARIHQAVDTYGECVTPHQVPLPPLVETVVHRLATDGLRAVLVGGSVRDSFDGRTPKDLDFEVYGGTLDQVAATARRFGRVDEVGKAFGVLKMRLADGSDLDLSVPRRDNKVAAGHRGFIVDVDPTLTVEEAAARRDFTINAMSYDSQLGVLIDPHHGKKDLAERRLRHVSPAFAEDPLRVMRGAQFAARYGMTMDPATVRLAQNLRPEAAHLPVERVQTEWAKFYSKGSTPSQGLHVLLATGWDGEHPGLADVNDSRLATAVDRMARTLDDAAIHGTDRVPPMAAVFARRMDEPSARAFLARTVEGFNAQRHAFALSRAVGLPTNASEARQMACEGQVSLRERVWMARAENRPFADQAAVVAEQAGVLDHPEKDLIDGRDVMAAAPGQRPGPWMGSLIVDARRAQAHGDFRDRASAIAWLTGRLHP